jgi:hypothetical protein
MEPRSKYFISFPIIDRNADSKVDAESDHWLNLNAFAARLVASQVLDLSLYAIWAMRDALEMPLEGIKPEVRDQTLRAAALWIEFCGENLHGMEKLWESDPRKGMWREVGFCILVRRVSVRRGGSGGGRGLAH